MSPKLQESVIVELIEEREIDRQKLEFELSRLKEDIVELKSMLKATSKTVKKSPGRRGRPAKAKKPVSATKSVETDVAAAPKRRGRPPKAKKADDKVVSNKPKKRGRPPKAASEEKSTAAAPKRRGRPAGTSSAKSKSPAPKKRGRKPKSASNAPAVNAEQSVPSPKPKKRSAKKVTDKGYRLSEWDYFILNSLKAKGKVLLTNDFIDLGNEWNSSANLGMTEVDIKGKINRSLHKMANKREIILKIPFEGRGFYYGLKEWRNPAGELKKKYQIK